MSLNKKTKHYLIILIFTITLIRCSNSGIYKTYKPLFVLDTVMSIKIIKSPNYDTDELIKKTLELIKRLDNIFNVHITGSELYQLNKNAFKHSVKVSPTLLELLKKSLYAAKLTNGAFDPAMLALKKIWNFKKDDFTPPSDEQIKAALKICGYKHIKIKNRNVSFTKKGVGLDLGGIAKGYIIDKIAQLFKSYGVKSAFINIGGDVYLMGKQMKYNREWKAGIEHPRIKNSNLYVLKVKDTALVTSGDYERYKIINGKRYHHIINPKTGYPASECVSMSVIAKSAAFADALSTGFFVLGPEKAFQIAKKLKNVYILSGIQKNGKIIKIFSPELSNILVK